MQNIYIYRRQWRTGGQPGALQSMGLQRVGHDWATEQQQLIMQVSRGTPPRSWADVLYVRTWLGLCAQLSSLTLGMGPRDLGPSKGNGDWTSEPARPSIPTTTQQLSGGWCRGERACTQACVILCNEAKAALLGCDSCVVTRKNEGAGRGRCRSWVGSLLEGCRRQKGSRVTGVGEIWGEGHIGIWATRGHLARLAVLGALWLQTGGGTQQGGDQ